MIINTINTDVIYFRNKNMGNKLGYIVGFLTPFVDMAFNYGLDFRDITTYVTLYLSSLTVNAIIALIISFFKKGNFGIILGITSFITNVLFNVI